jgi:hypothetical protein
MSWTKQDRDTFIKAYEKAYGILLKETDEMTPLLYSIYQRSSQTELQLTETQNLISELKAHMENIKKQTGSKIYNFQPGEAWKWQLGIAGKIISVFGVILAFLVLCCIAWWAMNDEIQKSRKFLATANSLEKNMVAKMVIGSDGNYFLRFKRVNGDTLKPLEEYWHESDSVIVVQLPNK